MRRHRESGQAAVETAIVMPFFVFFILGLLQLMLLHQGRLMVKYAAYKATRAGSIQRVKDTAMRRAAMAVLMPLVTRMNGETLYKLDGPMGYTMAWNLSSMNRYISGVPMVEVTVCNPTQSMLTDKDDFDSPDSVTDKGGGSGVQAEWRGLDRTRLSTQVLFFQPMVIPFANGVLWNIMYGVPNWSADKKEMMYTLRLKNRRNGGDESTRSPTLANRTRMAAMMGYYYAPVRATWSMRLMSNALPSALPSRNDCKVPWN